MTTIAVQCSHCQKTLELASEYAGAQAQCPACGTVFTAPLTDDEALSPESAWHLKTPEGRVYGPVSQETLDRWMEQGRIAEDCHLRQGDRGPWRKAEEVYPDLHVASAAPVRSGAPAKTRAPQFAPSPPTRIPHHDVAPHRGMLILILGILGVTIFIFPLFGIFAWTMGAADLEEMRKGRMDPRGRAKTNAGYLMGMGMSLLWIAVLLIAMFWLIFGMAI